MVQGGVLSPNLFNVYLDSALESCPTLNKLKKLERLLGFADDLLIRVNSKEEFV